MIDHGKFESIEKHITPMALLECQTNPLLMGMKVSFKLRRRADKERADEERFKKLANSVEEFTYRLIDPLRSSVWGAELVIVFEAIVLDEAIDLAIDLYLNKFFTHPAVHDRTRFKWYGGQLPLKRIMEKSGWKRWLLLLLIYLLCALHFVFSPILLLVCSIMVTKETRGCSVAAFYLKFLETPFFKYVCDTLSYVVLVCLHYALCLSPSTIEFSGLEWTILIFFVGRYLVERKQICDKLQRMRRRRKQWYQRHEEKCIPLKALLQYLSDCWNRLDFVSLLVYFIILILRVTTMIKTRSEMNNRTLAVAGYFYSFNTLCLTLRAFGCAMEQSRHLGTIQIALFSILTDISTIFWQFIAALLAFPIAITKVYMAEKSFSEGRGDKNEIACKNSGFSCWWAMFTHLGWSLLGVSEESDPMASVDGPSETIARLLYGLFLIFGVILLLNMLIAVLSNTYQRTEKNSFKVWSIKRAITIQTYAAYGPIPVPLNIIYSIFKLLFFRKKNGIEKRNREWSHPRFVERLKHAYYARYQNVFPTSDKVERVLRETVNNGRMVYQILGETLQFQNGGEEILNLGPAAWVDVHPGIRIEHLLLTCEGTCMWFRGARYSKPFSPEFPHFEVTILETGERKCLGVGVVYEGYDNRFMPGWEKESVGYHTEDSRIFHNSLSGYVTSHRNGCMRFTGVDGDDGGSGYTTSGPAMVRRGDRIRCTVMLDQKRESDGKVPVFFTLNGSKIIIQEEENRKYDVLMDPTKPLYPYIGFDDGCSVLAKMLPSENVNHRSPQLQAVKQEIVEVRNEMRADNDQLKADIGEVRNEMKADIGEVRNELKAGNAQLKAEIVSRVEKLITSLEAKLDVVLAKSSEK